MKKELKDSNLRLLIKKSYELADKVTDKKLEVLCEDIKLLIESNYPQFNKVLKLEKNNPDITTELEQILHDIITG